MAEVTFKETTMDSAPGRAWISHVIPFVAWICITKILGDPEGWKYAVRSVCCIALFLMLRPWQWYSPLKLRNIPLAIGLGVLVFIIWIAAETRWMSQFEGFHKIYLTFATVPPWTIKEIDVNTVYSPNECGWIFTTTRIVGSAFVISFIEEFFWRGWMYRWMLQENFLKVNLGEFKWKPFLYVALFFGFIHHRWLVGFICGIIYGLFVLCKRDIWAAGIAHMTTNLLLGVYVVWAEQYQFWS